MLLKAKDTLNKYKNKILFFQNSYSNLDKFLTKESQIDFFLLDL
jgi:16S rRNA C1402 N4-methylase RsmH